MDQWIIYLVIINSFTLLLILSFVFGLTFLFLNNLTILFLNCVQFKLKIVGCQYLIDSTVHIKTFTSHLVSYLVSHFVSY